MWDAGGGLGLNSLLAVMQLSIRNIQAINMFISSWALVFLALGILVDDWVKLNIETRANIKIHSPWIYSTIWPKGKNETLGRWVEREGSHASGCSGSTFIINTAKAEFKNLAISTVLETSWSSRTYWLDSWDVLEVAAGWPSIARREGYKRKATGNQESWLYWQQRWTGEIQVFPKKCVLRKGRRRKEAYRDTKIETVSLGSLSHWA